MTETKMTERDTAEKAQHSTLDADTAHAALCDDICQAIATAGGKITFADYMARCLYTPMLGYYAGGKIQIGAAGDFTTAPEMGQLFSRTLALQIKPVLAQLGTGDILEFGAGNGSMAAGVLQALAESECLPETYFILETSPSLQAEQAKTIAAIVPALSNRVQWLHVLPTNFTGVVLANEVCDAMPVHCLRFTDAGVQERYIVATETGFEWEYEEVSTSVLADKAAEVSALVGEVALYDTEINLAVAAWIASVAGSLNAGAVFIIDYGYDRGTYYHPQRSSGTLMCYHRHQAHDDPLVWQGLQDITAHVDFTALAEAAMESGLDVAGFQSQADFLLAGGLLDLATNNMETAAALAQATEIKRLTLPSEMGETFKVLTLTKLLPDLLAGIQQGDRRYSL